MALFYCSFSAMTVCSPVNGWMNDNEVAVNRYSTVLRFTTIVKGISFYGMPNVSINVREFDVCGLFQVQLLQLSNQLCDQLPENESRQIAQKEKHDVSSDDVDLYRLEVL